jgi:hypothetical protein
MTVTDQYIANVIVHQIEMGRAMDCPIITYLEANRDASLEDVVAGLVNLPQWWGWFSKEGLEKAISNYTGDTQIILQTAYARQIAAQTSFPPDGPLGRAMQRLLPQLTEPAQVILRTWLNESI